MAKRNWTQRQAHDVPPAVRHYLIWNDYAAAHALMRPQDNVWSLFEHGAGRFDHKVIWRAIEDSALGEWTAVHPGSRPAAWWKYSAPEPRRNGETETQYIERHALWLESERERVKVNDGGE